MSNILSSAALLLVGGLLVIVGYTMGTVWGETRTVNQQTAMAWARGHDEGCRDIVTMNNHYTGKDELVCEVVLQEEDEAVYIIRGEGSYDDY